MVLKSLQLRELQLVHFVPFWHFLLTLREFHYFSIATDIVQLQGRVGLGKQ